MKPVRGWHLQMQPSGRWAVRSSEREPVEIPSGELFRVDVDGELKLTRMEYRHLSGGDVSILLR
jgi:hypothetical protein